MSIRILYNLKSFKSSVCHSSKSFSPHFSPFSSKSLTSFNNSIDLTHQLRRKRHSKDELGFIQDNDRKKNLNFMKNHPESSFTMLRGRMPRIKEEESKSWTEMYAGKIMEFSRLQKESANLIHQFYYRGDRSDLPTFLDEIRGNVVELCMHPYGNFVIAEAFKRFSDSDRELIVDELMEREDDLYRLIPNLSAVAPLVEFIDFDPRRFMPFMLQIAKSKGGSLALSRLAKNQSNSVQYAVDQALYGHAVELSTHPYGNIVVSEIFKNFPWRVRKKLWNELISYGIELLIDDKYGIFVVSTMIHKNPEELCDVIPKLMESRQRSIALLKVLEEQNLESARFLTSVFGANLLKVIETEFGWTVVQACIRKFPLEEVEQFWGQIDSDEAFDTVTRTEGGSYVLGEMVKKNIFPLSHRIPRIAMTRGGAGALRTLILEEDPEVKEIILNGLVGHVAELARDKYGCSVIKLFIKRLSEEEREFIWKEILDVKVFRTIWNEVSVGRWVIEEMIRIDQSINVNQLLLKI